MTFDQWFELLDIWKRGLVLCSHFTKFLWTIQFPFDDKTYKKTRSLVNLKLLEHEAALINAIEHKNALVKDTKNKK